MLFVLWPSRSVPAVVDTAVDGVLMFDASGAPY